MDNIMDIEILKVILPACITGTVTFLVTKYNYHKNIPLDKLEVAYNRLYYPIYRLIWNNESLSKIIEESEVYLNKYNKYIDRSTWIAFRFLKNNPDCKKAYRNYKDNIYGMNSKLRRRLGYLEPNVLNMYTYSAPGEKRSLRIALELIVIYLSVVASSMIPFESIQNLIAIIFGIAFLGLMFEGIIAFCGFLKKIGRIIYNNVKKRK